MKLIRRKACYDSLKAKFEQCLGPHAPLPLPPANMVRWKGDEIIGGASLGETKTFFFFFAKTTLCKLFLQIEAYCYYLLCHM